MASETRMFEHRNISRWQLDPSLIHNTTGDHEFEFVTEESFHDSMKSGMHLSGRNLWI